LVQLSRSLLLLSFPAQDSERYIATLDKIIGAADVEEAIAFYQTLPLLPHPEKFQLRAAEGIRTNMTSVFKAIAYHNSYPAQYLDDLAWNQMVLKALFVGIPLQPIYGLSERNNPHLAQMLLDYARERLAAKRTVSPELWELVMPFQPKAVQELQEA
ncbi:MAG: EboA domain-containing protein, partial [Cyanobacteria bacterium J06635_13]